MPSNFTFTLTNISYAPNEIKTAKMESVLRGFYINSDSFTSFLCTHRDTIYVPTDTPIGVTADYVLDTLKVVPLQMVRRADGWKFTVHNIYIDPPTHSTDGHREWISLLKSYEYNLTKVLGHVLTETYHCHICKSIDHPKDACPFPNFGNYPKVQRFMPRSMQKSLATTPETDTQTTPHAGTERGRGRGRGRAFGCGPRGCSAPTKSVNYLCSMYFPYLLKYNPHSIIYTWKYYISVNCHIFKSKQRTQVSFDNLARQIACTQI